MRDELEQAGRQALEEISRAKNESELEQARIRFLGRKGKVTLLLRSLGDLSDWPREFRPWDPRFEKLSLLWISPCRDVSGGLGDCIPSLRQLRRSLRSSHPLDFGWPPVLRWRRNIIISRP